MKARRRIVGRTMRPALQFRAGRRSRSASASSGVTHRSKMTPHGHATVSRYPFQAGSVAPPVRVPCGRWSWTNSSRPARRQHALATSVRHSREREPSCRRTWLAREAGDLMKLQSAVGLSTQRSALAYRPQPSLLIGARGSRTDRRDDDRRVDDLVHGQGCLLVARPSAGL